MRKEPGEVCKGVGRGIRFNLKKDKMSSEQRYQPTEEELQYIRDNCILVDDEFVYQKEKRKFLVVNNDVYVEKGFITGGRNKYWQYLYQDQRYLIHNIIFFLENGFWTTNNVDHQDQNKLGNSPDNLREATAQQNAMNRKRRQDSSASYKGITWDKVCKVWRSGITLSGVRFSLGRFASDKEAGLIYDFAAKILFEEFANLNFPNELAENYFSAEKLNEIRNYVISRKQIVPKKSEIKIPKKIPSKDVLDWFEKNLIHNDGKIYQKLNTDYRINEDSLFVKTGWFNGQYMRCRLKNEQKYLIHVLVYFLYHNKWPNSDMVIHHNDGNKLNNRISNLIEETNSDNNRFRKKKDNATSKYFGVNKCGDYFEARISINNQQIDLGYFKDEDEAGKAYDRKALELIGEKAVRNFPLEVYKNESETNGK